MAVENEPQINQLAVGADMPTFEMEVAPVAAERAEPSLLQRYLTAGKNIVGGAVKIVANGNTGLAIREIANHQF